MSERSSHTDIVAAEFQYRINYALLRSDAVVPLNGELTQADIDELKVLRDEVNTQLRNSGHIGSDMVVHQDSFRYANQDGQWTPVGSDTPVTGRYAGLVLMSDTGRLAHIVDRYLYDPDASQDLGRYSYTDIENEAVEIFMAPQTEIPKEIWPYAKFFEAAIASAEMQDFNNIWQEVRGLTHNDPSVAVQDWFFDTLERRTGLVDQIVVCDSQRQFMPRLTQEHGMVLPFTNKKPHIEGYVMGFTTVPQVELREFNGDLIGIPVDESSTAELAIAIDDNGDVIRIPTNTCTSLIRVDSVSR